MVISHFFVQSIFELFMKLCQTAEICKMIPMAPSLNSADMIEDVGFFFRYQGGIKFKRPDGDLISPSGNVRVIQSCPRFGLTVYSDLSGNDCDQFYAQDDVKLMINNVIHRQFIYFSIHVYHACSCIHSPDL